MRDDSRAIILCHGQRSMERARAIVWFGQPLGRKPLVRQPLGGIPAATARLQPHVGTLALNNEVQAAVSRGDPSHSALLSPNRLVTAAAPQRPLTQRSASEPEEKRAYNMSRFWDENQTLNRPKSTSFLY